MLDTGDALVGGGRLGERTQGALIVAGMSLMGYDAMALGPMELSLGLDLLRERMAMASFPMLSANVVLSGEADLFAAPYVILERGDRRIGVIGLTRLPEEPLADFQVLYPPDALEQYLPEVSDQADTVILLTNVDYQTSLWLAINVPGIDLVVGALPGKDSTPLIRAPTTGTILVVADYAYPEHSGRRVGTLRANVLGDGVLVGESWQSVDMDGRIEYDPLMTQLMDSYKSAR